MKSFAPEKDAQMNRKAIAFHVRAPHTPVIHVSISFNRIAFYALNGEYRINISV